MQLTLPKSVLKTLPAPDRNGLVRVVVSLSVGEDGEATVSDINDVPVSGGTDDEEDEMSPSADDPEEEQPMPSADDIDRSMYAPQ